jgi:hypothetical protein
MTHLERYYHLAGVDLEPGQILNLTVYDDIRPEGLQKLVNKLFSKGLAFHGERYIAQGQRKILKEANLIENGESVKKEIIEDCEPLIELIFECVRSQNYRMRPSRFQSIYAMKDLYSIKYFRDNYRESKGDIWEVECKKSRFSGDMNLVTYPLISSALVMFYFAHEYWKGHPHPASAYTPIWEYLLTPPVKILRKIDADELSQLED